MHLRELVASLVESLHQSVNIVMLAIHQVQFSGAKTFHYLVYIGILRLPCFVMLLHNTIQHTTTANMTCDVMT